MRLPAYEVFNGSTHLIGVGLAILALQILMRAAEGTLAVAAFALYGSTLVLLYLMSSTYHLLSVTPDAKKLLGLLDRTSIYLVVAGTYTPPALLLFGARWGLAFLAVVWALAFTGIVLSVTKPGMRPGAVTGLYVGMGWLGVLAVKPLLDAVPLDGLLWLLAGGVVYTIGAVIYVTQKVNPWPRFVGAHGVWHLFVLAGSFAHFVFMLAYVAAA